MKTSTGATNGLGRFAHLLTAGGSPQKPYDTIVAETHGCVVAPTLGSIVPNWLLVIPRHPVVNFATWRRNHIHEPSDVVGEVLQKIGINEDRAIWLEHGPTEYGSVLGCGVDQAHIHIIIDAPFSLNELMRISIAESNAHWTCHTPQKIYSDLSGTSEYLLACDARAARRVLNPKNIGSQFFRRVIARLVEQEHAWDYKLHPYIENVNKTLANMAIQGR